MFGRGRWFGRGARLQPDPVPHPAPGEQIARLVGSAGRIVVFDCETTGLYAKDRVVEVALVTIGADGEILDRWESLINPRRDVGPTSIHGITGSAVADAPEFDELAGAIAVRLDGAVLAAHNLPFDQRMISAEFVRAGVDFQPGSGIDTLKLAGGRLGDVCHQYGIEIGSAHRALDDAVATAQLLLRVASRATGTFVPAGFPNIPPISERTAVRDGARGSIVITKEQIPGVLRAALRMPLPESEDPGALGYLELLERVLADLRVEADEAAELREIARVCGLDEVGLQRLHDRYLSRLIDEVVADGEVTAEDYEQLVRVAAALGLDQDVVNRRTRAGRSTTADVKLLEGMRICITGDVPGSSKDELAAKLSAEGFVVDRAVTKRTEVLVAADTSSQSGNAEKARRYDIPIVAAADMAAARAGDVVRATVLGVGRLVAQVCSQCGSTWTVPARGARRAKLCEECKVASRGGNALTEPGEES